MSLKTYILQIKKRHVNKLLNFIAKHNNQQTVKVHLQKHILGALTGACCNVVFRTLLLPTPKKLRMYTIIIYEDQPVFEFHLKKFVQNF